MKSKESQMKSIMEMCEQHRIWSDSDGLESERAKFTGLTFDGLQFTGMVFDFIDFDGVTMTNCVFSDCSFDGVSGVSADFTGSKFLKCKMTSSEFTDANFTSCIMNEVDLSYSGIERAKFRNAEMRRVNLFEARLDEIDLLRQIVKSIEF